jgi:hypothetical protein
LYYYEGKEENALYKTSDYSSMGIRKLIVEKRKWVINKIGKDNMVLIIKPMGNSNFKNLIDVIDESSISVVKRYYIDELTESENKKIAEISRSIISQ